MAGFGGRIAAVLVGAACCLAGCGGNGSDDSGRRGQLSGDASRADREKPSGTDVEGAIASAGIRARAAGSLVLCEGKRAELIAVPGKDAVQAWELARDIAPNAGRWPVLLGDDEAVAGVREAMKVNCAGGGSRAALREAERLEPDEVLDERMDDLGIKPSDLKVGALPKDTSPSSGFAIPTDITTGKPLPRVLMALLPTEHSWQAPALLVFGDYNDCPPAAVHAALHRDWERRFGSEIVGINADTIETKIGVPPLAESRIVGLAREQYVYAPDIVDQGTGDVATLAATLNGAPTWFFWWD